MLRSLPAILLLSVSTMATGGEIPLPARPVGASTGSEFARKVAALDLPSRDREILAEITRGNVPEFWRHFVEIRVQTQTADRIDTAIYRVAPDYLAVGTDEDYLLVPMAPATAQAIADRLGCVLPTRKMVDDIYHSAAVKLAPSPMTPSPQMTTMAAFVEHQVAVAGQRASFLGLHPLGALAAGHKKDVVITRQLESDSTKVAIYGWHRPDGIAIQPLYTGHSAEWVDYSHGIRLVERSLVVNGKDTNIEAVLNDPDLAPLLSDEGALKSTRYEVRATMANRWNERIEGLRFDPGVRVVINSPSESAFDPAKPTRLILYALPNGNTIEQTMGHRAKPGEDWHFEIQHIAAQVRWLRANRPEVNLVIVYLECAEKSWPAWRRKNDSENRRIPEIIDSLIKRVASPDLRLILTGHSGGGSFTFGFLNGVEQIPAVVERIAFLDSNYAYDRAQRHDMNLAQWLTGGTDRYLSVLAYHDALGLLDGKQFVSDNGGTWGRSHAMLDDLSAHFAFTATNTLDLQQRTALNGRVTFLLRENPTRAIFHTRMVEMNGFIHAMLTGTTLAEKGYEYLGPRIYSEWIDDE